MTKYFIQSNLGFRAVIKLDGQLSRATFIDQSTQFELNGTANAEKQCIELTAYVTFSIGDIFKPIELEMTFEIVNGIPQNTNGKKPLISIKSRYFFV